MTDSTLVEKKTYTADEFWDFCQLPENRDQHFELIDGEINPMTPAGLDHGISVLELSGHVWLFVRQHDLGVMTAAETGFVLYVDALTGKDVIQAPDFAFISKARVPQPIPETGYGRVIPDLVVEVVSPNDSPTELERKIVRYLQAGVRLVWVVYPTSKTILAHAADKIVRFDETMALDGGDVLPGFSLPVADLFRR